MIIMIVLRRKEHLSITTQVYNNCYSTVVCSEVTSSAIYNMNVCTWDVYNKNAVTVVCSKCRVQYYKICNYDTPSYRAS